MEMAQTGGPETLSKVTGPAFFVGVNDTLGGNPHLTPFTPAIFGLFNAWAGWHSRGDDNGEDGHDDDLPGRRASILRGQTLFAL